MRQFKIPSSHRDLEFEKILIQYRRRVNAIKRKAVEKYGPRARKWFGQ